MKMMSGPAPVWMAAVMRGCIGGSFNEGSRRWRQTGSGPYRCQAALTSRDAEGRLGDTLKGALMPSNLDEQFQTLHEIARAARRNLADGPWDYMIGGTETETTLTRNRLA